MPEVITPFLVLMLTRQLVSGFSSKLLIIGDEKKTFYLGFLPVVISSLIVVAQPGQLYFKDFLEVCCISSLLHYIFLISADQRRLIDYVAAILFGIGSVCLVMSSLQLDVSIANISLLAIVLCLVGLVGYQLFGLIRGDIGRLEADE